MEERLEPTPIEKGRLPAIDPDRPVLLVPINQVPDLVYLRIDKASEVDLEGEERTLHEADKQPLEVALQIRDAAVQRDEPAPQVLITAVDQQHGHDGIREALAMGADAGILLSSRAMAHSDATARANFFAQLARRLPRCDGIVIGTETMEADWSLIGGAMAAILGWRLVPGGRNLRFEVVNGVPGLAGEAMFGAIHQAFECEGPAVVTVRPDTTDARWPTSWAVADAFRSKTITMLDLTDLEIDGRMLARMQSLTDVRAQRIVRPERRDAETFNDPPEETARVIGKRLARMGFLGGF